MGIAGLLPVVKPAMKTKHINSYKGKRIGIDGFVWMHYATSIVATDLFHHPDTDKYVPVFMNRLKSLLTSKIVPIVVFDGDQCTSKLETNRERREYRAKCRVEAEYFMDNNNAFKAKELMKKCINITPSMVFNVIKALRASGIEYIISPYEADAQLCFLQKTGYIDYVLTVDSDLIVYGCTKILYKQVGSEVQEYDSALLPKCKDSFFSSNLLDICILSGCDYLKSIRGVGLAIAHKKLKSLGTVETFVEYMRANDKSVPVNYMEEFKKARMTFLSHIVYDPQTASRLYLSDCDDFPGLSLEFLGTLENLPYIVPNQLGDDFRIPRHYTPGLSTVMKINRTREQAQSWVKNATDEAVPMEEIEVDANIVSPYFQ